MGCGGTATVAARADDMSAHCAACCVGKLTQPLSGPGYVGLVNLGNSCYMSSLLQVPPWYHPGTTLVPPLYHHLLQCVIRQR
jgi:hypothetical protein